MAMSGLPGRTTSKMLTLCAALVFGASVASHVLSFAAAPRITMEQVGLLHVGTLALCIAMFGSAGMRNRRLDLNAGRDVLDACPAWGVLGGMVLFVYALVNFGMGMKLLEWGSPLRRSGGYALMDHGRLIRELSPVEYAQIRAYEVRQFSGGWIIASFLPLVYFGSIVGRLRDVPPVQTPK
jgi:hypothetical protein